MINLPYNVPLTSPIMTSQNVPVQTSMNNFQPFQQSPQTVAQQMQTNPVYPTNPQDPYKLPFYQLHQSDVFMANQYIPSVQPPRNVPHSFQPPNNLPPTIQTQPNQGLLPQNVLEQIRDCVGSAAPIFILPNCHQSTNPHQQVVTPNQGGVSQPTGQSTAFNYPPSICCPPSYYPYPVPLPVYEPFVGQTRVRESSRGCGCCRRRQQESTDSKNYHPSCCCNLDEPEEHRCTTTNDDTVCSKRNCPASISLQALASQFLSLPGIISCAATRLILRKVPGSNITTTMEDTMDKAQKAIAALSKEQLLVESRNAQQVNALINLHMTTNLPANVIPLLTLLQLKVNVLKAQVESLINKKVMECQGCGFEVESSGPIDPTLLTMKTNGELRQLLSALRQKECDERVNVNFSPYCSQRLIAESRLNNVQAKIRQVECEFDRRRCVSMPTPTLTSRVIQQFAGSTCTFGFAQTKLFEPYPPECTTLEGSPDPFFSHGSRNPKRLYLKPRAVEPEAVRRTEESRGTSTSEDGPSTCKDTGTGEGNVDCSKKAERRYSEDTCSCTSSEDSLEEDKKKLRPKVDRTGKVRMSSATRLREGSLSKSSSTVVVVATDRCRTETDNVDGSLPSVCETIEDDDDKRTQPGAESSEKRETNDEVERDDEESRNFKDELLKIPKEEDSGEFITQEVKIEQGTSDSWKLPIKEEYENDANSWEQFDPRRVKTEPESVESMETFDYAAPSIGQEEPEENDDQWDPLHLEATAQADWAPETVTTELRVEVEEKTETGPSEDVMFVSEKWIPLDEAREGSEELAIKEIKVEKIEEEELGEADDESFSAQPPYEETDANRVENDLEEQATENEASPSEQVTDKQRASEVLKNYLGIKLKRSKKRKPTQRREATNESEGNSNENGTYPENGKNGNHGNVQIVSMMTRIEYDRRFDDLEKRKDLKKSIDRDIKDRDERDSENSSKEVKEKNDVYREDQEYFLSKTINSIVSADEKHNLKSTVHTATETYRESEAKSPIEKMFARYRRVKDERSTDGIERFPRPKAGTAIGISEDIIHRKEIESDSSKAICDRSTSYHRDSNTGNSIVTTIYSMIENRLASLNTLLTNIPNLHDLTNLWYDKLSRNVFVNDISTSNRETINRAKRNKKAISRKDDCIFGENRVSVGEDCGNIREMRQTIIVDKGNDKSYALIGGSIGNRLKELSRNGFERPYRTRRTLVIRSRPKDPENSKHDFLRPFTILKRSEKDAYRLSASEKFCSLPDGLKDDDDVNENDDEHEILRERGKNRDALSIDRSLSRNERTTSVHDYVDGTEW